MRCFCCICWARKNKYISEDPYDDYVIGTAIYGTPFYLTKEEREGLRFTTFVDDVTMSSQKDFKHIVPEIIQTITSHGFKISQGKTTYKSGITKVTGVNMLNNSMAVTDKFKNALSKEPAEKTPRVQGMINYKERIAKVSASKRDA